MSKFYQSPSHDAGSRSYVYQDSPQAFGRVGDWIYQGQERDCDYSAVQEQATEFRG